MHADDADVPASTGRACPLRHGRPCASLHTRLIGGLLLTIASLWGVWFAMQWMRYDELQTGAWDRMLHEIAQDILHALPRGFETAGGEPAYPAPPAASADGERSLRRSMLLYQVVDPQGRLLMRSASAPRAPMLACDGDRGADVQVGADRWRAYCVRAGDGRASVLVAKPYALLEAEARRWFWSSLSTAVAAFVLLALVVALVIHWSLRPVERVRRALYGRDLNDATALPTEGVPGELRPLIDEFNRALERLHMALQVERRFLADAAHELRTPLAALRAQADVAGQARSPDEVRAALRQLGDGIDRCARLSAQMLDMARLEHGGPADAAGPVELSRLVDIVARDFEGLALQRRQRIELDLSGASVMGHVDELGILVRNLLDNALRYGHEGGRVELRCGVETEIGRPPQVVLRVRDDGPGVPPGERHRICDRFVRLPGARDTGAGIGLSLVHRVVTLHGARLEMGDGLDGRGLEMAVIFMAPATTGPALAPAAPSDSPRGWAAGITAARSG